MQTEVLNYIEFLSERYPKTNGNPIEPRAKRGGLGSLKDSRSIVSIDFEDTQTYSTSPFFDNHRDPFDRDFVAQVLF